MNKGGWCQAELYCCCSLHPFWPRVESVVVYHVALVSAFTSAFMWNPSPFLEKEMATHSSICAWKIPWREETGRLQSTGSQRVGHDSVTEHITPLPLSINLFKLVFTAVPIGLQLLSPRCHGVIQDEDSWVTFAT